MWNGEKYSPCKAELIIEEGDLGIGGITNVANHSIWVSNTNCWHQFFTSQKFIKFYCLILNYFFLNNFKHQLR